MVRLSAKNCVTQEVPEYIDRKHTNSIVAVHEALNSCYTDSEALRMILERYADLYVRYIQVWRELSCKVSRDITVMELVNLTQDRPGVNKEEPLSEAKAYVARMLNKVSSLSPRSVGDACAQVLKNIDYKLSDTAKHSHKDLVEAAIRDIRDRLDRESQKWSWDSHMNDLYFDIRCDLTVLDTLVGIGSVSVKTLLHERFLLVSQLRKLNRKQGSIESELIQIRSRLRESENRTMSQVSRSIL